MITSIEKTAGLARGDWLKLRRKGIGGSDVAAILGLNKWRTPLDVYNAKTSTEEPEEEMSDAAHFGTVLEDVVAKEFAERVGVKVQRVNYLLRSNGGDAEDWMVANIDRAVIIPGTKVAVTEDKERGGYKIKTMALLECKTCSAYSAVEWGPSQLDEIKAGTVVSEHKIPVYYETQVQWYMAVTGIPVCFVAVLIGGQEFRAYLVRRDDDVIAALKDKCRRFWFENVKAGVAPQPSNAEEVAAVFPKDNGELREADNAEAVLIGELRTLQARMATIKEECDAIKSHLATAIGEKLGLSINGEKALTFKTQVSKRFDTTAFKKNSPALYETYCKESTSRVMRLV